MSEYIPKYPSQEGDDSNKSSSELLAETLKPIYVPQDLMLAWESHLAGYSRDTHVLLDQVKDSETALNTQYQALLTRVQKYEQMLQDITMDSNEFNMGSDEENFTGWNILAQASYWDYLLKKEITKLSDMIKGVEYRGGLVSDITDEILEGLIADNNYISNVIEALSDTPLIRELSDALNTTTTSLSDLQEEYVRLAQKQAADAEALTHQQVEKAEQLVEAINASIAEQLDRIAQEAAIRTQLLQELEDRANEMAAQAEADVAELTAQVDSIREGATADKASILETVNNYKTELKSDIATVNTELLGALDGVNTLVTEVRDENGVTLNELTTYKSSNDVAVAGLLSKVTTNISDTAANASKITGLTTELATTNVELGTVRNTSANALNKADTVVTANSALATRVDSLVAAITDLGEGAKTAVDVHAFNALKAEVGTNAAGVSSLVEQVNSLGTNYTNLTDGVQANTDAVSKLTVKQSEMNGDISQLSSDVTLLTSELGVTNTALNTKASNQALSNLNTKLTTTDGKVAANTQQLTQLNSDLTTVKNGLETKASTEALNNLATGVTELAGGLAVNASAITNLKSEIATELNKKATVTAVNGLTTKVEEVEGKTTTNANNILALNTSVGNVVNGLANKLDASAISDYYTKQQADGKSLSTAAGEISKFSATLRIGGDNLLKNSNVTIHKPVGTAAYLVGRYDSWTSLRGKKFTLTACVSVTGGTSAVCLIAYQGSGLPIIFSETGDDDPQYASVRNSSKAIVRAVVDEWDVTASGYNDSGVNFYIYPNSPSTSTNMEVTIHWATLVEGDVLPSGAWYESDYALSTAIDANATAIQNTNAEVTRVDGRVTATNSAQTLLEGRVQTVEGGISKKADASALSSLDTRVGSVEGKYTSQASDITKLSNSLDTTNVNVGTAQTAAQNAMNAAGAKGKVIFGNTAPVVADRLVQNLWIDTTGNANTPKRWNGSAWVVVTDKVATDAAKAVSDLDNVVKTKADVTALNSLTTKVSEEAGKTTANTNSITTLNSDITRINNDISTKANASALSDMYTKQQTDDKATEIAAGEVNKFNAALSIGTENLITQALWQTPAFSAVNQADRYEFKLVKSVAPYTAWAQFGPWTNIQEGTKMVLSFKIKALDSTPLTIGGHISGITPNGTGVLVYLDGVLIPNTDFHAGSITIPNDGKYHLIVVLMTKSGTGSDYVYIQPNRPTSYNQPVNCSIKEVMLSVGTAYVEWDAPKEFVQNQLNVNSTAIESTNAEVTRVDGRVTTEANRITSLTGRVSTVEGAVSTKADASALNSLTTRVATEEGKSTSQGSAITSLQNTINHATTGLSTKASSAALTAVDNKVTAVDGRVTTTNSAVTNLTGRISTVEGNLTTKADASAVNALTTRVGNVEGGLSTQASDMTALKSSLGLYVLPTDKDTSQQNKWARITLRKTQPYIPIIVVPDYSYIGTYPEHSEGYFAEGATTTLPIDHSINYYRTLINVAAASTINLGNLMGDDAHAIYVDGKEVYSKAGFSTDACSFEVTAGEHVVDIVVNNGLGGAGFSSTITMSSQVSSMYAPKLTGVLIGNKAEASAIQTTNTEVSRINDVVKGHVTDIRNLTTNIAGKADSSALNELTVRVADEERKTSTQATSITNLNSSLSGVLDTVTIKDARSTDELPNFYWTYYSKRRVNEFKYQTVVGVSSYFADTYCNLETVTYWTDASGGPIIQTATSGSDPSLYVQRQSVGSGAAAVWSAWKQPIKDLRDSLGTKASASAVSTLDTKVEKVDGRVTTQASQILTLTSDNTNNKNALQVQAKVVDGVKANYMVKMETNGIIGGFGLMQSTGVLGQVKTSFGVNADSFFIGAPTSKKKPFIVTTSGQEIDGVTYPAGTYIDVALIANATIGTAKIADLAVTNAKIVDATIESAKIKSIKADKIEIGNPLVGPITPSMVTGTSLTNAANLFNGNIAANATFATYGTGTQSATSGAETNYIQVDVGATVSMPEVRFFFRGSAARKTYIKLKASVDGVNWDYIMGSAANWETIDDMPPGPNSDYSTVTSQASFTWYGVKPYRYLRIYGNGSSASATNEIVAIIGNASGSVTKIGSEGILTNSITADKIKVDSLSAISANLGTIEVGTANIAKGAITTAKIGDLQVDTLQIKDRAITVPITIEKTGITPFETQYQTDQYHTVNADNWFTASITGLSANSSVIIFISGFYTAYTVTAANHPSKTYAVSSTSLDLKVNGNLIRRISSSGSGTTYSTSQYGSSQESLSVFMAETDSNGNINISFSSVHSGNVNVNRMTFRYGYSATNAIIHILELKK